MTGFHGVEVARRFRQAGLWGDRLLVDFVDAHARRWPAKPAVIDGRETLTYRELVRRSENVAMGLLRLGVRSGEVVAVQAPNWSELVVAHLALDRIGGLFLPLHEDFREAELEPLLRRARARVVMVPGLFRGVDHRALVRALQPVLPELQHLVVLRGAPALGETAFDRLADDDGWRGREEATLIRARPHPDDPLSVMVSSGTTALPKCSVYSDNNTVARLLHGYARHAVGLTPTDIAAALAPAGTGATGYTYPILAPLLVGATSVLLERWSGRRAEEALELMRRYQCTYAVVIPTQLVQLADAARRTHSGLPPLRFISTAGAPLTPAVAEEAEFRFHCRIQTIYGASDAGAATMTTLGDPPEKRWGSVGRPIPGQELCIVDAHGRPLGLGQAGEICWRGTGKSYGFLHDPAATATAWDREGWYHSGDLGALNAEGYLSVIGRQKDIILRGGRNISPQAIEAVLLEHPAVLEAAAVPVPDPVLGERVCAVIVVRRGAVAPLLGELRHLVSVRGLARWHQPEALVVLPELPRNAGGKVDKRRLAESVAPLVARRAQPPTGPSE